VLDFTGVKAITIPEGSVKKITRKSDSVVLWEMPATYKNLADPNSSDWADGYRLSSSGALSAEPTQTTTQYIPCKIGDILRVKGIDLRKDGQRLALYNSSKACKYVFYCTNAYSSGSSNSAIKEKITYANGISTYTLGMQGNGALTTVDTAYFRLAYKTAACDKNDLVITLNEEIT
jgi:hypothetical protein